MATTKLEVDLLAIIPRLSSDGQEKVKAALALESVQFTSEAEKDEYEDIVKKPMASPGTEVIVLNQRDYEIVTRIISELYPPEPDPEPEQRPEPKPKPLTSTERVHLFRRRRHLEEEIGWTLTAMTVEMWPSKRNRLLRRLIWLWNKRHPGSATTPSWSELKHESNDFEVQLSGSDSVLRQGETMSFTPSQRLTMAELWGDHDEDEGEGTGTVVGKLAEDTRDYWFVGYGPNCPEWIRDQTMFKKFYEALKQKRPKTAHTDALLLQGYYCLHNDEWEMWDRGIGYPGRKWNEATARKYRQRLLEWGNALFETAKDEARSETSAA